MEMQWARILRLGAAAAIAASLLSVPAKSDDKNAALYKQKCATCHGADGKGDTPAGKSVKVRSFASPETAKMSDQELADVIEKGKGKIPKYGASMNSDEIKAMVAYPDSRKISPDTMGNPALLLLFIGFSIALIGMFGFSSRPDWYECRQDHGGRRQGAVTPAVTTLAGWIDGDSAGGRMKVEGRTDGRWTGTRKP